MICGWTRVSECLVLGHVVFWGSFEDDTTWFELDELLKTQWTHPHGGRLKADACCIDAGDGQYYDRVLAFCQPRASKRVMAIKGASGTRPAIVASRSKVKGGRLWIVGVDGVKSTIFDRLQRGRMIRFSERFGAGVFRATQQRAPRRALSQRATRATVRAHPWQAGRSA